MENRRNGDLWYMPHSAVEGKTKHQETKAELWDCPGTEYNNSHVKQISPYTYIHIVF